MVTSSKQVLSWHRAALAQKVKLSGQRGICLSNPHNHRTVRNLLICEWQSVVEICKLTYQINLPKGEYRANDACNFMSGF